MALFKKIPERSVCYFTGGALFSQGSLGHPESALSFCDTGWGYFIVLLKSTEDASCSSPAISMHQFLVCVSALGCRQQASQKKGTWLSPAALTRERKGSPVGSEAKARSAAGRGMAKTRVLLGGSHRLL